MTEAGALYGQALYELAAEEKKEEQVYADLKQVAAVLAESPEYLRLMDSYTLPKQEKASLLDAAFGSGIQEMTLNTMKLLMERNMFHGVSACAKSFTKCYHEAHNIAEARIVSAVTLTPEQADKVCRALSVRTGKTIEPEYVVDPAVRGGIRIEAEGVCYDNTILTRLERINRLLSQA